MKKRNTTGVGVGVALVVALGVGVMFLLRAPSSAPGGAELGARITSSATTTPALGADQSVTAVSQSEKKYTDTRVGFSFTYPSAFTISSFGSVYDSAGKTILLQSDAGKKGLQVLVTQFDEDTALTDARIHRDLPSLTMSSVTPRQLGSARKRAQAVVFTSTNSAMGESREAWFVYEKRLYQISAPLVAQEAFTAVLDSWQF